MFARSSVLRRRLGRAFLHAWCSGLLVWIKGSSTDAWVWAAAGSTIPRVVSTISTVLQYVERTSLAIQRACRVDCDPSFPLTSNRMDIVQKRDSEHQATLPFCPFYTAILLCYCSKTSDIIRDQSTVQYCSVTASQCFMTKPSLVGHSVHILILRAVSIVVVVVGYSTWDILLHYCITGYRLSCRRTGVARMSIDLHESPDPNAVMIRSLVVLGSHIMTSMGVGKSLA